MTRCSGSLPIVVALTLLEACGRSGFDGFGLGGTDATSCASHATTVCQGNDVYWSDACGHVQELARACPTVACDSGACPLDTWVGVGGSALTRFDTIARWGSGAGDGIAIGPEPNLQTASFARAANGDVLLATLVLGTDGATFSIRVVRWTGEDWAADAPGTGDVIAFGGGSFPYLRLLAASDGALYLLWSGDTIRSLRFDGSKWLEMGSGSSTAGMRAVNPVQQFSATVDAAGRPILAWYESDGLSATDIYVRRWSGSAWTAFGNGSDSGGGISSDNESSTGPVIAMQGDVAFVTWLRDNTSVITKSATANTAWIISNSFPLRGTSSDLAMATDHGAPVRFWTDTCGAARCVYAQFFSGGTWIERGGSATGSGISTGLPMVGAFSPRATAFDDPTRGVLVAWDQVTDVGFETVVRAFDGASWRGLDGGDGRIGYGDRSNHVLLVDRDGQQLLGSVRRRMPVGRVFCNVFDGARWGGYGTVTASGGGLSASPVAVDAARVVLTRGALPLVVWSTPALVTAAWNGSSWERPPSITGTRAGFDLASNPRGEVVLVYPGATTGQRVFRWSGTAWSSVGGDYIPGSSVFSSSVALADDDTIMVIENNNYDTDNEKFRIDVYVWRGQAWSSIAPLSSFGEPGLGPPADIRSQSVVAVAAGFFVVYYDDSVEATRAIFWDGSAWNELGGSMTRGFSQIPQDAVAFRGPDGEPAIAWAAPQLYALFWNGSAWVERAGSASAGGLSDGLAVADVARADSATALAFRDLRTGNAEVGVARWVSDAWLNEPDRSQGGVSRSTASSYGPGITQNDGVLCATWLEATAGSSDVVMRCRSAP